MEQVATRRGTHIRGAAGPSQEVFVRLGRAAGPALIVLVMASVSGVHPGPGAHGRALGVSVALVVLGVAGLSARWADGRPPAVLAVWGSVIASSAALVGLQRGGPGALATYVGLTAAAWELPWPQSVAVAGAAAALNGVAWGLSGAAHSGLGVAYTVGFNEVGVVAFYLVALLARHLRQANDHARELLVELEASRDAQVRAAASTERQRLAREMHDVLAHSLSGLMLNLEGARLLAERGEADPALTEALERARRLARDGLDEARRAIGVLRESELPGPSQFAALLDDFEAHSGIPCRIQVSGAEQEVRPDARLAIYRVTQEALANIARHAQPERVEAHLSCTPSGSRLVIEDFSSGPPRAPSCERFGGYGLTGMRERAELAGGSLQAAPTPSGFRVELWLPA